MNFTGTAPGTVYNWTNSAPSIGLAASGSGNIASFVAVNNSGAQIRATISVTPALSNGSSSCPGRTVTFNISVNPTPTVTPVANQSVCKGSGTQQVTLSGPVAGTTYSWTNNNTMIGLNATGTNTVPAFVAQNPTANPIAGTVTITPNYLNGVRCFGPAITYTYTVQNCAPRLVTKGAAELPAVEKELAELVTVGPNPTPTGLLYIYYSGDASRRLSYVLTDAQGRMLHTAALQGSRTQVDLRGYAAGSYLLQVRDAQTGASVKQVILRP
ncbi:MAG: T9SS type A sorting domain-containing protein [Chitinophagaceae bacterium]|nr:MAG: T9SS type A sorting domain-containing protein [Chitinophagaceae bacterium]